MSKITIEVNLGIYDEEGNEHPMSPEHLEEIKAVLEGQICENLGIWIDENIDEEFQGSFGAVATIEEEPSTGVTYEIEENDNEEYPYKVIRREANGDWDGDIMPGIEQAEEHIKSAKFMDRVYKAREEAFAAMDAAIEKWTDKEENKAEFEEYLREIMHESLWG